MPSTLLELADDLDPAAEVTLMFPTVRFRSQNESSIDRCLDWRADIVMLADTGHDDVLAGYVDFLVARRAETPGVSYAEILDSFSSDAERFSILFGYDWLRPDIEEQFDVCADYAVLALEIYVEPLLRGHQIGPWALAEVAHHMLPSHTGLIVVPAGGEDGESTVEVTEFERRRGTHRARHWSDAGLVPLLSCPEFLCGSAAYTHMDTARQALADTAAGMFVLSAAAIREHATILDADPC